MAAIRPRLTRVRKRLVETLKSTSIVALLALSWMCYALSDQLPNSAGDRVRVSLTNLRAGDMVNFTFADNVTGYSVPVVPDVVHFVFLGNRSVTLLDAICIRAAWLQKKPRRLVLHCQNCSAIDLSLHWALIERIPGLDVRHVEMPEGASDIGYTDPEEVRPLVALSILLAEGGIYVDRDTYLLRSASGYRRFEMALAWPNGGRVRTELIVAHRNARLLRMLYDGYRRLLTESRGTKPIELLSSVERVLPVNFFSMPLFHHIPVTTKDETARMLYSAKCDYSWRHLAAVSLMTGSAEQLTETRGEPPANLVTIALSRTNFGQMARLALGGTTAMGETRVRDVSDIAVLQYTEDACSY
ncbi:hypothetical protein HPB49_011812 [Dermacentor silvarum]|uniref:Uncharacterized protein n=1 Tax=Dermacentor silvarum TaxID=543639 RepID=A0ACB8D5A1_DERSI|nr:hypothetical protein HPB49_011812 [Dermacentor silvarum]